MEIFFKQSRIMISKMLAMPSNSEIKRRIMREDYDIR